jgi:NADPH:quinone reductase
MLASIPQNMIAISISEPGSFNVLKPVNRIVPLPASNEVLIRVAAAGVNRPDIMQRQGAYPPPPGASDIPGLEISGAVVRRGSAVNQLSIGSDVCALVPGGGYAEYCLAPAELCLPVPDGFSMIQAAALPETFFTVWSNVFDRAQLKPGETLLLHGGTSGIGTTAIQLAKAFGAKVIVTAGSEDKCAFCVELGADSAINYRTGDFVKEVLMLTDHQGVDVVLDMIGGDYFARNLKCMAEDGRLVQIAIQNGAKVELNLWHLMAKRLTLTGSTLRARDIAFKAAIADKLKEQVWPLLKTGKIRPIIHAHFPLTQANKAHELMESSQHIGKIILTV